MPPPDPRRPHVLIVEDDAEIAGMIADLLRDGGYLVQPVTNGMGALASVAEAPPGVVVFDLVLPVVDGVTPARELRQASETRPIPLIVVSAAARPEVLLDGVDVAAVIRKPFEVEVLVDAGRRVFELPLDLDEPLGRTGP